jgi:glycosyltransferase involved in cell wall biosynthesis
VKVLWVKAERLLPVQNGGNIRSYHIARGLARDHQVTFFSYYSGPQDVAYERELAQEFPGAVCVCTGGSQPSSARRALDYLFHLSHPAPYAVSRFANAMVRKQLRHWFREHAFDVAVCDFLDAAINFPPKLTIPSVLFQHNVESEIWRRHVATSSISKRALYKLEFQKMQSYEASAVRHFHHVIAVSQHDRELMGRWVDPRRITVEPTGVDLTNFARAMRPPEAPLVLFVGAMDWEPNVDAVEYFCDQIWPGIRKEVPAAKFRIVGRNPDRRVRKLASDSIEVTGSVPSVQPHLQEAAVVVVPLRIGGGTRLKIYEAMAVGKAVVSTSIGAEGLDVHDGRDIVLADGPSTFAQAVQLLLNDAAIRSKYERAAWELAQLYGWPAIGKKFADVLEAVAGANREAVQADSLRMPKTMPLGDAHSERGH